MAKKCSVCKEKGHDKRQCPIRKEEIKEAIKIKQDRFNLVLSKIPEVLNNPVFMGLLWYQASKDNEFLSYANNFIIGSDALGLNVPSGATLGAVLQKADRDMPIKTEAKLTATGGAIAIIGAPFFYVYPQLKEFFIDTVKVGTTVL